MLAINTTFNTSVLTGFGQNFGAIKVITPFIQQQVVSTIQQALSFQLQNNQITLGDISMTNNGLGQISVQFIYTNNTLGAEASMQFILP